jgi:hypothetical protein
MFSRVVRNCVLVTTAALIASTTMLAQAGTAAFTAPATNTLTRGWGPNQPVNLGTVFTANSSFNVDSLGIYRDPSLTGSEIVGLFDFSTHALLASTTVQLTDTLAGSFLYHAITPVSLLAGHQYEVTAFVGNNPWTFGPAPATDSRVTYNSHLYNYSNQLAFASNSGGSGAAYFGANFTIASVSAVPEPESYALMLAGLAGLTVLGKRKNKSRRA